MCRGVGVWGVRVCMFLKFVPAGVPVALDFLTDLANLWSV